MREETRQHKEIEVGVGERWSKEAVRVTSLNSMIRSPKKRNPTAVPDRQKKEGEKVGLGWGVAERIWERPVDPPCTVVKKGTKTQGAPEKGGPLPSLSSERG